MVHNRFGNRHVNPLRISYVDVLSGQSTLCLLRGQYTGRAVARVRNPYEKNDKFLLIFHPASGSSAGKYQTIVRYGKADFGGFHMTAQLLGYSGI